MIRAAGCPVPGGSRFERQYVGWAARSAGAWAWFLVGSDGIPLHPPVGSQWPRRKLARGIEVTWDRYTGSWQVDPPE